MIFTISEMATDFVATSFAYVEQNVCIGTPTIVFVVVVLMIESVAAAENPATEKIVTANVVINHFIITNLIRCALYPK